MRRDEGLKRNGLFYYGTMQHGKVLRDLMVPMVLLVWCVNTEYASKYGRVRVRSLNQNKRFSFMQNYTRPTVGLFEMA